MYTATRGRGGHTRIRAATLFVTSSGRAAGVPGAWPRSDGPRAVGAAEESSWKIAAGALRVRQEGGGAPWAALPLPVMPGWPRGEPGSLTRLPRCGPSRDDGSSAPFPRTSPPVVCVIDRRYRRFDSWPHADAVARADELRTRGSVDNRVAASVPFCLFQRANASAPRRARAPPTCAVDTDKMRTVESSLVDPPSAQGSYLG